VEQHRPGSVHLRATVHWVLVIVGAALLRAALAASDNGIFWPDEIHQSLEQAHRAVFGYGLVSWEFRDGARSWLFPGSIAALWKLVSMLGVDSSMVLVVLARLAMAASSVVAIIYASKLAAVSGGKRAAIAAAVILATLPPSVVFAYRAMSETASAPLIVIGAWLLWRRSPRAALYAGVALATACLLRYQNGLFVLVFAAALILQRRWREVIAFATSGAGVALLGGLLDWATWGRPFHSLLAYVDFNLVLGGASTFGVEPFWFYLTTLWSSTGPLLAILAGCFVAGCLVEPVIGGAVVAYVLAHSVLPHKEFRFLVPCLPLFACVAAVGVDRVLERLPAPRATGALAAAALTAAFGYALFHLEYQDLGQYRGTERATLSVWNSEEETSLLLSDAGQQSDICGVAVLGARAAFTGGYTYLHRDVPLIYESELCNAAPANYVISTVAQSAQALPHAYKLQRQRGNWALYRRDGVCVHRASDDDRLLEGARDMGLVLQKAKQSSDGALHFDLQRDSAAFAHGWGHGEVLDCDAARWVDSKRAFVDFDFTPQGPQYILNFRARAHEWATPQRFGVAINGERVHVGPMSAQLKTYSIDIPESALNAGKNRIEFAFSRNIRPSSEDNRELSALFRSMEIVPKQDDFSIDVALAESRHHLVKGFQDSERAGDMTFAWSDGPTSEIEGVIAWPRSPYVLQILAEAVPLVPSQETRVFANDTLVGTVSFQRQWSAQRLVIPARALVKGKNRIRLEYQATARPAAVSKKLADPRELAVRFRRIELTPLMASSELDFGTAAARPFMLEGWSGDEHDNDRSVVWSNGPRASAVLSFQGLRKPMLKLSAQGFGPGLPINVKVFVNDKPIGAFAAPDGWQNIAIPMPSGDYTAAGEIVTFEFDRTARPSDGRPKINDNRQLALRVDRVWVEDEDERGTSIKASVRALQSARSSSSAGIATTSLEERR
jgi:GPI mannosyltransferase 3